jgi:hypothetical protein
MSLVVNELNSAVYLRIYFARRICLYAWNSYLVTKRLVFTNSVTQQRE